MQIVFHDGTAAHELDVVVHDPDATVADLVRSLAPGGPDAGLALVVEGVAVAADRRLDRAGITEGATVAVVPAVETGAGNGSAGNGSAGNSAVPADERAMAVSVVGGLDAGARR